MQIVRNHILMPTMNDCSHRPSSSPTPISMSRSFQIGKVGGNVDVHVSNDHTRSVVDDLLCHIKDAHDDIPCVRDDQNRTGGLKNPLKEHLVSTSCRLLRSVISWMSSMVMMMARITPAIGRITFSESERIML